MSDAAPTSQTTDPVLQFWQNQQKITDAQTDIVKSMTPSFSGITIAKDQLSATSGSGLGGVFVSRASRLAADDLSVIVREYVRKFAAAKKTLRLIGDLGALNDLALLLATQEQIKAFDDAISFFVGPASPSGQPAPARPAPHALAMSAALPGSLFASAGASVAGQLLAVVSQLLAGAYQYSGQTVDPGTVPGLDFAIGNALQRDGIPLKIAVDRLDPPIRGTIYADLASLVDRCAHDLQDAVTAEKKAAACAPQAQQAEHQPRIDQGNALAAAIAAFATSLLTAQAGTAGPPIARAAHGERMSQADGLILYARLVESGMDVLTSERLHDTWTALAGVSVEYAIFDSTGDQLTAGTRVVIERFHGNLRQGLPELGYDRLVTPYEHEVDLKAGSFSRPPREH